MGNLEKLLTWGLAILFLGYLFVANINCDQSALPNVEVTISNDAADSTEGTTSNGHTCLADCQKACCLGCKATEGTATCLPYHSCCADDHEADAEEVEADSTAAEEVEAEEAEEDDSGNASE